MGVGLIAGRYRLRDRLGVGGMSEVWSADDEEPPPPPSPDTTTGTVPQP